MPTINVESNVLLSKPLLVVYIRSVLMCFWFFCSRKLYFHSILYHRLLFAIIYFLSLSEIARTLNSYTGRQFLLGTFSSPPCTHYYSMYLHPVAILRICSVLVLRDPYLFFRRSRCPIFRFHRKVSGIQVCQLITLSLIYICNIVFCIVVSHLFSQLIQSIDCNFFRLLASEIKISVLAQYLSEVFVWFEVF